MISQQFTVEYKIATQLYHRKPRYVNKTSAISEQGLGMKAPVEGPMRG
jgi:hypothetical protein